MSTIKLIWQGEKSAMEKIEQALSEMLFPPADAVCLQKDDPIEEDSDSAWRIEAYFTEYPEISSLKNAFNSLSIDWVKPIDETLPDIDWVAHSLEGLGIVETGRFVLYGVHDGDKLPDLNERIAIRIDANQAFGTGHHPTTAGCLKALEQFDGAAPKNILDLGTGSAVLAIAADKLWGSKIIATDIDQISVDIAAENAALNQSHNIEFICADGFDHEAIIKASPFDFIFANILAGPLCEFAPAMAAHCQPGGTIILAGLLDRQEAEVTRTYQDNGFSLLHRLDQQTWPVLMLRKR